MYKLVIKLSISSFSVAYHNLLSVLTDHNMLAFSATDLNVQIITTVITFIEIS